MRPHEWNIFAGDPALSQGVSLARDRFLSELGGLLAGAMRHVAAPPAAEGLFRHHTKARGVSGLGSAGGICLEHRTPARRLRKSERAAPTRPAAALL